MISVPDDQFIIVRHPGVIWWLGSFSLNPVSYKAVKVSQILLGHPSQTGTAGGGQ